MSTSIFYPVLLRRTNGKLDRQVVRQDCSTREEAMAAAHELCTDTDLAASTTKAKAEKALKEERLGISLFEA